MKRPRKGLFICFNRICNKSTFGDKWVFKLMIRLSFLIKRKIKIYIKIKVPYKIVCYRSIISWNLLDDKLFKLRFSYLDDTPFQSLRPKKSWENFAQIIKMSNKKFKWFWVVFKKFSKSNFKKCFYNAALCDNFLWVYWVRKTMFCNVGESAVDKIIKNETVYIANVIWYY